MRSRTFFFTTATIIGIVFIVGAGYAIRKAIINVPRSIDAETSHISVDKIIQGAVTDVMAGAKIVTVKDMSGQEIAMAIVSETKIIDEHNAPTDIEGIKKGSVIKGKGESVATNTLVASEVAIISVPEINTATSTEYNAIANPSAIKTFFNSSKLDPAFICDTVFPMSRVAAGIQEATSTITGGNFEQGRKAIEELLKGPDAQERSMGYFTNIDPTVKVNGVTIDGETAQVDFSQELGGAVAGSCRAIAIRAQIAATLKQFPSVTNVIISINGNVDTTLRP